MRDLIYAIAIYSAQFFFSVSAIFGIKSGEDSTAGPAYVGYCIIVFTFTMLNFVMDLPKINHKSSKMFVPLLIILIYILSGVFSELTSKPYFLSLGAFSLPATLAAISFSDRGTLAGLVKWLDVLVLIFAVSLPRMMVNLYATIQTGVTGYSQALSYMAANVFLLSLFLMVYGTYFSRFRFTTWKVYRIVLILILALSLLVSLFSGGRGAFMAIIVGVSYVLVREVKGKTLLYSILSIGLALVLFSYFTSKMDNGMLDVLGNNSGRVLEYVTDEGIDMSATSGRDGVYKGALKLIGESPLYGYGLFGYMNVYMHPHNLFLEILLQGGVLFFIAFMHILYSFFKKLRKIIKRDNKNIMLLPMVLFVFTELMFSGTYMAAPLFWFTLTYVYLHKLKGRVLLRKIKVP